MNAGEGMNSGVLACIVPDRFDLNELSGFVLDEFSIKWPCNRHFFRMRSDVCNLEQKYSDRTLDLHQVSYRLLK
jgi:hypothetical protein